ncbi:hypothetical protein [Alteromonas halophila]|nr:hypothetical protein [Alteromonas halophila]
MVPKIIRTLVITSLFLFAASSKAVIIEYDVTDLGGGSYQYDYTVINDDLVAGVEEFSLFFDYTLFTSLSLDTGPTGWLTYAFNPDLGLPDDGLYGAFIDLASPIALGDMLGGFSVVAQYIGAGMPGSQFFEVYDIGFNVVAAGNTQRANTADVAEPGALALLLLGLAGLSRAVRRRV